MGVSRRYLAAIVLLAVFAIAFGVFGTFAPPLAEEGSPVQPQQESSSESVGHFTNPPSYDSGWVDITTKCGQYVILTHNLNTTDVTADIRGKQSLDPMGGTPTWNKTYGGSSSDFCYSLVQTQDGGYALAGLTNSYGAGGGDFWLIKTGSTGGMQMSPRTYGGASTDTGYSVVQTSDGGYAIAGWTDSYGAGAGDFWLVKTDASGNTQWSQTYGGASTDHASCVAQTADGGYALAGYTQSYGAGIIDFWLVKTNSSGGMLWSKTYGGTSMDEANSVIQTDDGGYAIAGYTYSYGAGGIDCWLVKTDSAGNHQWNKTYGGTGNDYAFSLIQTADGGYAIAGYTNSFGAGGNNFWLVKTDSTGNLQWSKTYGGTATDYAFSLIQTADGGYAIAGYTNSFGAGNGDFLLVKTNSSGSTRWSRTYGGTGTDVGRSVVQIGDGSYALAGYTNSYGAGSYDFWLVKVNEINMGHQRNFSTETGLAWMGLTNTTIVLYRGSSDIDWNYVRVRMWLIKEPSWIYGDINMDGVVDNKDLYIIGRNYGKTFSLLSLTGIIAVASIHTIKTRKQQKPHNKKPTPTEPLAALWEAFQNKKTKK